METYFSNFIGIDVSKDSICVFSSETSRHFEVPNDPEIMRDFFSQFPASKSLAIIENTGGYENKCLKVLDDLDITIHRTDNNAAKHFFLSLGRKAKTDKIDAKSLAMYGNERHQRLRTFKRPTEKQEEIRALTLYLENLKDERVKEKNRLKSPGLEAIHQFVANTLKIMDENIANIEKKLDELIEQDPETVRKLDLLTQYKGIGKTSAIKLLAFLPELGQIKKNAIVALSGLAPYANDSGTQNGYRTTKVGGRKKVKRALFMAALSTVRFNQDIAAFYNELIKRGKSKRVALTASMRKMIVQLNAILRNNRIRNQKDS
jgi:transposase